VSVGHPTIVAQRPPDAPPHILRVGNAAAVEPMLPCRHCAQCEAECFNLCSDWSHLGILEDGCWADFVRAPAARVTALPDGVTPFAAALAEPLACAVNVVARRGRIARGETVLIMGAGPLGLLSVCVAKSAGAGIVVVSEPQEHRRKLATTVGADVVIDPLSQDVVDVIAEHVPGPSRVDLIVEATGTKAAAAQSIMLAVPGSRIVLAGFGAAGSAPIDPNDIVMKELTVRGAFASSGAMSTGLQAIANGHVRTDGFVTSVRPWADADGAMHDMVADPGTCKILFSHS
jgi:2-desacetyl-2-hydroxyethyl bacteriochlorophyllide A dehydrogenase